MNDPIVRITVIAIGVALVALLLGVIVAAIRQIDSRSRR